jgi:hypothetical protein
LTIHVHQCISGFTQTAGRPHGILKLCEKLHAAGFNNCISRVSLRCWNDRWSDVAENLWLLGEHHQTEVVVNIYAYSWGVGWGAVQLARELQKRSISVHTLVACDGVYRHKWFRTPALLKRDSRFAPTIKVPGNVRHVLPFHQTLNVPQGHRIVGAKDFSGTIGESYELHATHQYCDDDRHFHTVSLKAAESLQRVN